jgi:YebC/PmpR family DNA-binding regulatory protein
LSGHSKWATTKYRKGAQDKARGKLFAKLIRQIEVAAREAGGDLSANAALRTAYAKARDASVPSDTIERAIKRGTGELEGVKYESISYEGYGPGGVALIVECLTDNRNRTGSDMRTIFSRAGGSLAEPGAVSWQFERKGILRVSKEYGEDDLIAICGEAGADDIEEDDQEWVITCPFQDMYKLKDALEKNGIKLNSFEPALVANQRVPVSGESEVNKVLKLMETLEDHDDVQNIYDNADLEISA